jgi:hypothetical protein
MTAMPNTLSYSVNPAYSSSHGQQQDMPEGKHRRVAKHRAGNEPPITSRNNSAMTETWIACYRQRVAHAVPADVHSPAYDHPHGLIDAMCGIRVYPLRIAETGARRCKHCTEKLPLRTSDNTR